MILYLELLRVGPVKKTPCRKRKKKFYVLRGEVVVKKTCDLSSILLTFPFNMS